MDEWDVDISHIRLASDIEIQAQHGWFSPVRQWTKLQECTEESPPSRHQLKPTTGNKHPVVDNNPHGAYSGGRTLPVLQEWVHGIPQHKEVQTRSHNFSSGGSPAVRLSDTTNKRTMSIPCQCVPAGRRPSILTKHAPEAIRGDIAMVTIAQSAELCVLINMKRTGLLTQASERSEIPRACGEIRPYEEEPTSNTSKLVSSNNTLTERLND
jgi:hypothetical protein